jgi:transposase-like protein
VSVGVEIYSRELKDGAVKQVLEGGHSVSDVAKRLGISKKSLYTWPRGAPEGKKGGA